ncbi:MAG: hypothetical protein ACRC4N_03215 [Gammaproteobacteria bacterium]
MLRIRCHFTSESSVCVCVCVTYYMLRSNRVDQSGSPAFWTSQSGVAV